MPIVGTPVGGIPDFLKDGEIGLFCRVDDPQDLAEKIKLLMTDEELAKQISEKRPSIDLLKNIIEQHCQANSKHTITHICYRKNRG